MRNLGLSPFFNKGLEKIFVDWRWPYVAPYLARDQLGGRKGCGTNHYLARLIQFLYTALDKGGEADRREIATMAINLSKAFNRLDHSKILTVLFDIGTPVCALRLLRSYLTARSMRVHQTNAVSDLYELWGP